MENDFNMDSFWRGLGVFFLYLIVSLSSPGIVLILNGIVDIIFFRKNVWISIVVIITFGLLFIYSKRNHWKWSDHFRFTLFPPIILFPLMAYVSGYLIIAPKLLELIRSYIPFFNSETGIPDNDISLLNFLRIVFIVPFIEECVFRGIILGGFLKRYKPGKSIILSAIIFGINHFNPRRILITFLDGLYTGYVYTSTHSLIPCIIAHVLNNGLLFYIIYLHSTSPELFSYSDAHNGSFQSLCLYFIGIILIIFSIWGLIKFIRKQKEFKGVEVKSQRPS